eukprot:UN26729
MQQVEAKCRHEEVRIKHLKQMNEVIKTQEFVQREQKITIFNEKSKLAERVTDLRNDLDKRKIEEFRKKTNKNTQKREKEHRNEVEKWQNLKFFLDAVEKTMKEN